MHLNFSFFAEGRSSDERELERSETEIKCLKMNGQRRMHLFSCITFKTDVTQSNDVQKKATGVGGYEDTRQRKALA